MHSLTFCLPRNSSSSVVDDDVVPFTFLGVDRVVSTFVKRCCGADVPADSVLFRSVMFFLHSNWRVYCLFVVLP